MEIEYQKHEVTWCLDREGPRICLRAVSVNDEIQHLQISSESFSLELKTTEAQEFLSILKSLAEAKKPSIPVSEALSPDVVKELSNEIFQEKPKTTPTFTSSDETISETSTPSYDTREILEVFEKPSLSLEEEATELSTLSKSSPQQQASDELSQTLDASEILDVLKQSEVQEEEKPAKIRRLGSLFGPDESISLTPSEEIPEKFDVFKQANGKLENDITQLTDILIGKEEPEKVTSEKPEIKSEDTIEGIIQEENVKPSVVLGGRVDTASFFQKAEIKSPLEQLLEEDKKEDESVAPKPVKTLEEPPKLEEESLGENILEPSEKIAPFSPDDLQSSSFVSDFNVRKEEIKSEVEEIFEVENNLTSSDGAVSKETITTTYKTETERKKEIEKEREARKKRLWELTRGF